MKCIIGIFAALLLVAACNGNKCEPSPEENKTAEDTVVLPDTATTDTLAGSEDVEPPVAADGLFDDFVYGFMKNRKFQTERIKFPLTNKTDGENHPLTRKDWTFDPLYAKNDTYTMIFNSEKAMSSEKDTAVNHVIVEWIYLDRQRVKQYVFNKERGKWMLTALEHHALEKNRDSDFYAFYRRFATDTEYQQRHIRNPFTFKTYDYDNFQQIEGLLDVDQWPDYRPDLPHGTITNIRYGQPGAGTDTRILIISSLSGGMNCNLTFRKNAGKWMLVKMEN